MYKTKYRHHDYTLNDHDKKPNRFHIAFDARILLLAAVIGSAFPPLFVAGRQEQALGASEIKKMCADNVKSSDNISNQATKSDIKNADTAVQVTCPNGAVYRVFFK